jgi:diguanylate cyclase
MTEPSTLEEAAAFTRLTLPLMVQHGIPTTPRNYATWYQYVAGTDEELKGAIDRIIGEEKPFTEETNEMLYRRFCADKEETATLVLRENLRDILARVLGNFVDLSARSDEYEAEVSSALGKLSEQPSPEAIRAIVDEIIDKTKDLGESGKEMQQRLNNAAEELKELKEEFERAKTEALVDFLTRVANRKAFDEALAAAVAESHSKGTPLSLLMIDIDHFKKFNDTHGHLVGDEVLKFTAAQIQEVVRGTDFVARYGGEEFSVLLPETPLDGAARVGETVREVFAQGKLKKAGSSEYLGQITVSIGVGQYRPNETAAEFVQRSDQALYLAKENGRNRVATESELLPTGGEPKKVVHL